MPSDPQPPPHPHPGLACGSGTGIARGIKALANMIINVWYYKPLLSYFTFSTNIETILYNFQDNQKA